MRKVTNTQPTTGTWAASTVIPIDIERIGVLSRLNLTHEITPSATLTAANQPDGVFRTVVNARVVGGQRVYFNVPGDAGGQGGTLLHYVNKRDGFGIGHPDGVIAAPSTLFTPVSYTLHCGSRPRHPVYGYDDPFDLSAFVPASREAQLRVEWTTSANSVMDDAVTISSGVMRVTNFRVIGTEDELRAEMHRQGVDLSGIPGATGMTPTWTATSHVNVGATTDYDTEQIPIPAGAFLKRIDVLSQDASATRPGRASDELTRIAIKSLRTNEDLFTAFTHWLYNENEYGTHTTADSGAAVNAGVATKACEDFNVACPFGMFVIDMRPRWHPAWGMDLRSYNNNDYALGLYIGIFASGDDTLVIFERYQPYFDPLTLS